MPRARTGETRASIGEVVVAACQNPVADCAFWSRAQVQQLVDRYAQYCSTHERRAIVAAGFSLGDAEAHAEPGLASDSPHASPAPPSSPSTPPSPTASHTPSRAQPPQPRQRPPKGATHVSWPKGKRELQERLRELAGDCRTLEVLSPSSAVFARTVRTSLLITFGCAECRMQYTMVLSKILDPALNAARLQCLCTTRPREFVFKNAYCKKTETFYNNLAIYASAARPRTTLCTSLEDFAACRGSVVLRCTACGNERRTTPGGVFFSHRDALAPCPCLAPVSPGTSSPAMEEGSE